MSADETLRARAHLRSSAYLRVAIGGFIPRIVCSRRPAGKSTCNSAHAERDSNAYAARSLAREVNCLAESLQRSRGRQNRYHHVPAIGGDLVAHSTVALCVRQYYEFDNEENYYCTG